MACSRSLPGAPYGRCSHPGARNPGPRSRARPWSMLFSPCYNLFAVQTLTATRYVQPLREGGSLPAVVETEDGALYVVKFRGAGHGAKALVAELITGLTASALGLPTPELALMDVPAPFGRSEPDPEIQDILQKSHGINVGAVYLDG